MFTKQKRLNEQEIQQIIAGYKNGLSMDELASNFGCYRTTISQKLKAAGATIRRLPPSDNQIAKMVELYQSGLTLEDVGKRIGKSARTVLKYLQKLIGSLCRVLYRIYAIFIAKSSSCIIMEYNRVHWEYYVVND
jgi:AraC-like DNA-binding protein